jgi:hypothetical protein
MARKGSCKGGKAKWANCWFARRQRGAEKQNIIEGSSAATTSKETEIKLTNVARASLEELLEDYRDFLRVRNLRVWEKDCREAKYTRELGMKSPLTFEVFPRVAVFGEFLPVGQRVLSKINQHPTRAFDLPFCIPDDFAKNVHWISVAANVNRERVYRVLRSEKELKG